MSLSRPGDQVPLQAAIPPFASEDVAAAFAAFPAASVEGLLGLRRLIFETAAATPGVGPLTETLKWGQPAYLTAETKSGTTVRLGAPSTGGIAIYTHCQTSVISDVRDLFEADTVFDGNRAVIFEAQQPIPEEPVRRLIAHALTYHQKKRRSA